MDRRSFLLILIAACMLVAASPHRQASSAEKTASEPFSRLSLAVVDPGSSSTAVMQARDYNRNIGAEVADIDRAIAGVTAVFERNFARAVRVSSIEDARALLPDLVAVVEIRYSLPSPENIDAQCRVSATIVTPEGRRIDALEGTGAASPLGFRGTSATDRIREAIDAATRQAEQETETALQSSIRSVAYAGSLRPASNAPDGKSGAVPRETPVPASAVTARPEQRTSGGTAAIDPFRHLSLALVVPRPGGPAETEVSDYNRRAGFTAVNTDAIIQGAAAVFKRNFKSVVMAGSISDAAAAGTDLVAVLEVRYSLPKSIDDDAACDMSAAIMMPDGKLIDTVRGSAARHPRSFFSVNDARRIGSAVSAAAGEADLQMEAEIRSSVRTAAFAGRHPVPNGAGAVPGTSGTGAVSTAAASTVERMSHAVDRAVAPEAVRAGQKQSHVRIRKGPVSSEAPAGTAGPGDKAGNPGAAEGMPVLSAPAFSPEQERGTGNRGSDSVPVPAAIDLPECAPLTGKTLSPAAARLPADAGSGPVAVVPDSSPRADGSPSRTTVLIVLLVMLALGYVAIRRFRD